MSFRRMEFSPHLRQGVLERRYKRFFADIRTAEGTITAHVPNTGSLKGCLSEGAPCLYSSSDDPKRKLAHTLVAVQDQGSWVGVNTGLANQLVWEAYLAGRIPHWRPFQQGRREVKINAETRLDMGLWSRDVESHLGAPSSDKTNGQTRPSAGDAPLQGSPQHFVEIKSVTMKIGDHAAFPDAVTSRGLKHLETLADLIRQGFTAELVFVVQRNDCAAFCVASEIDSAYAEGLQRAVEAGVQVSVYPCQVTALGIELLTAQSLTMLK